MRTASSIPQRLHRRIEQHRWRVRVGGVPQGERGASKLMLKCAEDREGSVEVAVLAAPSRETSLAYSRRGSVNDAVAARPRAFAYAWNGGPGRIRTCNQEIMSLLH